VPRRGDSRGPRGAGVAGAARPRAARARPLPPEGVRHLRGDARAASHRARCAGHGDRIGMLRHGGRVRPREGPLRDVDAHGGARAPSGRARGAGSDDRRERNQLPAPGRRRQRARGEASARGARGGDVSGAAPAGLGEALAAALRLESFGATAGNVTVARGSFDGRPVHVARVENRAASGSIGAAEAERLTAIFRVVAIERSPLVLDLDSAGAKVSEGLEALGAFRRLFRAGLDAAFAGAPIAAVLGRNCFGGSSMLAHLAGRRLFGPATRLGMSGPAVIAAASGMDPLDASFQAMAEAAMSPEARAAASAANTRWTDAMHLVAWLREALAASRDPRVEFRRRHDALAARLSPPAAADAGEPVRRRDLERIYPQGCDARESHGLLAGRGRTHEGEERFVGLVGDKPLGAQRAWRFADLAWRDPGGGTLR